MAANLTIPNSIVDGASVSAAPIKANFDGIASWVNTNAVQLDGSKPMTAELSGTGSDPTSANQYARKAYVDAVPPLGTITMYAAATAPNVNWLICDGSAVSRTTYATLFVVVSTTWGVGNGTTTFNIPDLRGRAPIGVGTGASLTARALATNYGEENHVLTTAELASHTHGVTDPTHSHTVNAHSHTVNNPGVWFMINKVLSTSQGKLSTTGNAQDSEAMAASTVITDAVAPGTNAVSTGISIQNNGSGTGHNTLQPSVGINFIIKAL